MNIKAFFELSQEQQDIIYSDSMLSDIDTHLSFALIENNQIEGYALLQLNPIEDSIRFPEESPIPFDTKQTACKILSIKVMNLMNETHILLSLYKKALDRIEMWYDKETGFIKYFWAIFNDEGCAKFAADTMDGDTTKCLLGVDSLKYLIYKVLPENFTE